MSKPPGLLTFILLIYSLCLIDSISAFGGGIQSSTKNAKSSLSNISRGREWIGTKLASSSISFNNNQEDNEDNLEVKAQNAIQYCSKICIISFLVDMSIQYSKLHKLSPSSLTSIDFVNLFDKFSLLIFGSGLYRISKLYNSNFHTDKRFTHEMLIKAFRTKSIIYCIIAIDITLVSLSLAVTLPSYSSDMFHELLFKHITSRHVSFLLGFIICGGILIQNNCRISADREIDAYRREHGINIINKHSRPDTETIISRQRVRQVGFRAYRNMVLCSGSFFLSSIVKFIKWFISYDYHNNSKSSILNQIFGVSSFLTPFIMSILMYKLTVSWVKAAISEVFHDLGSDTVDRRSSGVYNDLFLAQYDLYHEAGHNITKA